MAIDVNDLKILINAGFKYLIKTCHQWAKDHPLVSAVLLFFYLLYIFFPTLFDILFYTFPLIICVAIILGGKHIRKKENQEHTKNNNNKKYEVLRTMSIDHRQRRRRLTSQMSRKTLEKFEETEEEDDDILTNESLEKMEDSSDRENNKNTKGLSHGKYPTGSHEARISSHCDLKTWGEIEGRSHEGKGDEIPSNKRSGRVYSYSDTETSKKIRSYEGEKKESKTIEGPIKFPNHFKTKISRKIEGPPSHESKPVEIPIDKNSTGVSNCPDTGPVGKTEPTPLQDENNKDNNADSPPNKSSTSHSDTESQDEDEHEDEQPSSRNRIIAEWTEDDQRNLMDLGSSEIERNKRLESLIAKRRARKLLSMQPRRSHYYPGYENLMDQVGSIVVPRYADIDMEHQPGSAPCALRSKKNPFDLPYDPHEEKPILTGGSFDEEFFINHQKEFLIEDCSNNNNKSENDDFVAKFLPSFFTNSKSVEKPPFTRFQRESEEDLEEMVEEHHPEEDARDNNQAPNNKDSSEKVEASNTSLTQPNEDRHELENPFAQNFELPELDSISSSEMKNKDEHKSKHTIFDMESVDKQGENDEDKTSSSSSSSSSSMSSREMHINANKNEAFRNSVKKVLNCLIIQRTMGNQNTISTSSSNGLPPTSTKMDERSYYTSNNSDMAQHTATLSIASDMQVEVSETGSPTDRESLVYDGDVDKDANSGDEDLWGASPHPTKQGEFAPKFKLPDITEEQQANTNNNNNDSQVKVSDYNEEMTMGELTRSMTRRKGNNTRDQRSIDAEIIETRSSASSSSDGLTSQMQAKSEHLAEYLANLPPAEAGSAVLEEPEPEPEVEAELHPREINLDDAELHPREINLDDAKDESREHKETEESRPGISLTSETGAIKETSSTEQPENEPTCEEIYVGVLDDQPMIIEDQPSLVENDVMVMEQTNNEKETIPDSYSTTCQDEIFEQSRLEEQRNERTEDNNKIINDEQVIIHSAKDPVIQEEKSTLPEKSEDSLVNQAISDDKKLELDGQTIESNVITLQETTDDAPQQATIVEDNMDSSSTIDGVNSRPEDNLQHNSDRSV